MIKETQQPLGLLTEDPHDKDPHRKKQQSAALSGKRKPKKSLTDAEAAAFNRYLTENRKKHKKKIRRKTLAELIEDAKWKRRYREWTSNSGK